MGQEQRASVPETEEEIVALMPALRAFARTFHSNINDADDLVQETLTKALSKVHQFTPGTRLKSWLFTIMRNTHFTHYRISQRESPGKADCVANLVGCPARQEWPARQRELSKAIYRLPCSQREVIMLIGVLGFSYKEAAEVCGCEIGTVKSRLNRARLRLLQDMEEDSPASTTQNVSAPVSADIPLA